MNYKLSVNMKLMFDVWDVYSVFSVPVDEYIAIAKEKHGYNMEQVNFSFSQSYDVVRIVSPLQSLTGYLSSGSGDALLAQTQHWEISGRPAELHSVSWWVDGGGQSPVWTGLQLPREELPPHPANGKLPLKPVYFCHCDHSRVCLLLYMFIRHCLSLAVVTW